MKCPECNVDLLMGERLTVPIDYCPKCRGIWLEKGRIEQLTGSSQGREPQDRDAKNGNHSHRRDDDDDERGIGGFLRGILD
jgi:Zn-finger nucleic acid-binding protein